MRGVLDDHQLLFRRTGVVELLRHVRGDKGIPLPVDDERWRMRAAYGVNRAGLPKVVSGFFNVD